jgi:hypothetical protein
VYCYTRRWCIQLWCQGQIMYFLSKLFYMKVQWHLQEGGPSWLWSYGNWIYNYLCNHCLSPLMLRVQTSIRARCTTLCDKVCQWLATGRSDSSTNKTDRQDITEILLKEALNTIKKNKQANIYYHWCVLREWISENNITSKVKPEMWQAMGLPLQTKKKTCQW